MTKATKILLGLSIVGLATGLIFVTGLVNVGNMVALYVALPVGAIFFGLFLISKLLEKDTALFDNEQRTLAAAAQLAIRPGDAARAAALTSSDEHGHNALASARAS